MGNLKRIETLVDPALVIGILREAEAEAEAMIGLRGEEAKRARVRGRRRAAEARWSRVVARARVGVKRPTDEELDSSFVFDHVASRGTARS